MLDGTVILSRNGIIAVDISDYPLLVEQPIAVITVEQTFTDSNNDDNESVTLDGLASSDSDGMITSYVWTENSTQIATGATPTVDLVVGTHTITLTVTDDDGATATDEVVITVIPLQ